MTTAVETNRARVAIVDDERHIRELLEEGLQFHGFATRSARDGQSGLRLINEWKPDLIVLDVMMPKMDGISLLPEIRRLCESPIVILSAKGDVDDRVTGIERGADDYMAKPFNIAELVARLKAALRRPHLEKPHVLAHEDLRVDLLEQTVRRGDRTIRLTPREYDLLVVLLRHPGRIFNRDHLLDSFWGDHDVSQANVDTYICYLRAKIDLPGFVSLIQTSRGMGYSLRAS